MVFSIPAIHIHQWNCGSMMADVSSLGLMKRDDLQFPVDSDGFDDTTDDDDDDDVRMTFCKQAVLSEQGEVDHDGRMGNTTRRQIHRTADAHHTMRIPSRRTSF
jgi:hypothetical protein